MLTNQHIFILGLPKFDGPYESTNYTIAKMLAKDNDVYYIDNPYTWKDFYQQKNTPEFKRREPYFKASSTGLIDTEIPRLKVVITQPVPSINFLPEGKMYRILLKYCDGIITKRIKQIIQQKNIPHYIFINSFNFHYPTVADGLNSLLTVYHCVDPLIRPFDTKHGIISQNHLIKTSDVVLCTSRQLYNENKTINPNTYFIANAADISHSQKALNESLPVASVLNNIPKPIMGYFGNIERRIDYEMMKEVIAQNQDKSFVFVGPQEKEFLPDWFQTSGNLYLTGGVPYSEMPAAIKGFDVALLPFKKDEVSSTIFPLKLFEYLGAGKPVVAINFNDDLKEFTGNAVAFCEDANTFSQAINEALINDDETKKQQRLQVAANNTWTKRIEEIKGVIESTLAKKSFV